MASGVRKVGIYIRVSTEDQNCDLQLREIKAFVEREGWAVVRVYQDKASGLSPDRRMLDELMRDCRDRKINTVVVWRLDRLYRSMKHAVVAISQLHDMSVDLVSLKEKIDMTDPTSQLLVHVLLAFAQWEVSVLRLRVKAGLAAAKARGVQLGRRSVITPSVIEEIYRQHDAGISTRNIAANMRGRISKSTVDRVLRLRKRLS